MAPAIHSGLVNRVRAGELRVAESLHQVFAEICGAERTREERFLFLLMVAPMARKAAMKLANDGDRIGTTDIRVADIKMWLWWLDTMDPLCARMIDLHYFAGLSLKETAEVLDLPTNAIIRELRFAKRWLMLRLTEPQTRTAAETGRAEQSGRERRFAQTRELFRCLSSSLGAKFRS